jgi:N6-L-threonylcarbamoyladenine synthase
VATRPGSMGAETIESLKPILAIETSCDETSAAVVSGTQILGNVVSSQIELHRKWGGVVPEAAARAHVEAILPVIESALNQSGIDLKQVGAIAVTNRPGLIGALSVGVSAAKSLAFALDVPLLGIHHLEGHLLSTLSIEPNLPFPHTCLIVSGGHTELVQVEGFGKYRIVGQTRDDAAGEAFDKAARLLRLGSPGGWAIQQAALNGDPGRYPLPKGLTGSTIDFSFSGLKTAMLRLVQSEGPNISVPDASASIQATIVDVLTERAIRACTQLGSAALTLVGGVAANLSLRSSLQSACDSYGIRFITPAPELCTDNAAMIGLAANWRLAAGERDNLNLDCYASVELT